jgi:plasmid replication initiation protein
VTNQKKGKDTQDLVVKSNRIITAFQNLSLTEMCLIQLAIVDARDTEHGLDINKPLNISAKRYAEIFNVQIDTAYKILASAGKGLRARYFTFLDATGSKIETNWVQQVRYVKSEGRIEIIFTVAVVKEITRLSSHFTQYDLEFIATLNSIYSVRLYELIIKWLSAKKTDVFDYEILRGQLGIGVNEYQHMGDFKKRVLDLAVNEINDKTNIKVKYENVKQGRKIIGFTFTVHEKPKAKTKKVIELCDGDMFAIEGLNDNQLGRIARNPSFVADYNHMVSSTSPAGQDPRAWEFEMINRLKKDASQFKKRPIKDYLEY